MRGELDFLVPKFNVAAALSLFIYIKSRIYSCLYTTIDSIMIQHARSESISGAL